jgi:hypothetical protein
MTKIILAALAAVILLSGCAQFKARWKARFMENARIENARAACDARAETRCPEWERLVLDRHIRALYEDMARNPGPEPQPVYYQYQGPSQGQGHWGWNGQWCAYMQLTPGCV